MKSAGFDASCAVTASVLGLTSFPLAFSGLSGLTAPFCAFSPLSGSVLRLCTCLETESGVGGAGGAGEWALKMVCCDLIVDLSLSLCARAAIGDKWLEGFVEDINVSVRRGILLGLRLL